jgi:cGMP-inhibited 3',5'-cyclic phosphodiesterase A
LYNDKSVLENHHAAASWHLLTTMPENNFLMQLEEAELKRFRFLLIECILATDLKLHFDIVRSFKEKAKEEIGIDWTDDVERLQVMKMVIKMADINTATKSFDLHRAWTVRITEEFYQQHDDENKMNLPKTIFMSREEKEKLPAIQVSFIQNLVAPLFHVCAESGIIPGMLIDENEKQKDNEDEEDIDEDDVSIDEASSEVVTHKVVSIILTNLEMNFEAWKSELPPPSPKNEKDDNDDDN